MKPIRKPYFAYATSWPYLLMLTKRRATHAVPLGHTSDFLLALSEVKS